MMRSMKINERVLYARRARRGGTTAAAPDSLAQRAHACGCA
ncbi:hypothetical protein C7S16_4752 [Burkholderia thailandensis]|uniref:Uncharacterized protein n=1 Tax=Burkholderia thailandensis TaxID=57975 RepID=A0AAW9CLP4_BURTH|nr:hypothetical protein [Burkholderia thailandensis]MDW9250761.1 hypothetical protein [Burkholderia thailandensis]